MAQRPVIDELCTEAGDVYCDSENIFFSALLHHVDIQENKNRYYKMQLIECEDGGYGLFKNWGRVGVDGQNDFIRFSNLNDAKKAFAKLYREKTKNTWKSGTITRFPGKYYPSSENDRSEALSVLNEIRELINNGEDNAMALIDASNRYYTLDPHPSPAIIRLPVINTIDMVVEKQAKLQN